MPLDTMESGLAFCEEVIRASYPRAFVEFGAGVAMQHDARGRETGIARFARYALFHVQATRSFWRTSSNRSGPRGHERAQPDTYVRTHDPLYGLAAAGIALALILRSAEVKATRETYPPEAPNRIRGEARDAGRVVHWSMELSDFDIAILKGLVAVALLRPAGRAIGEAARA